MCSLFAINKDKKHIKINILGIKLRLKRLFDSEIYKTFMTKKVEPNTILITEFNGSHYETIPGLCKYCTDFGYNVDVLTREPAEGIFQDFPLDKVRVYECNEKTFDKIYKNFDFSEYERIIYNSKRVYYNKKQFSLEGFDLSKVYNIKKGKKDNIYLQHHIDKLNETPNDKQIILANPANMEEFEKLVVNSHYFKENVNTNRDKNEITNFISIGELSKNRRNSSLLIDAVKELNQKGIKNFKVTIIGVGKLEDIPEEIQYYFEILGRVDYQKMFEKLEQSDFILPLLDPNIKSHKRYMDSGTSGSFQLIYGFNKPCIIHKTFADIYNFDNSNSIIYPENEFLANKMIEAVELKNSEYLELETNLSKLVQSIDIKSRKNLKSFLDN